MAYVLLAETRNRCKTGAGTNQKDVSLSFNLGMFGVPLGFRTPVAGICSRLLSIKLITPMNYIALP